MHTASLRNARAAANQFLSELRERSQWDRETEEEDTDDAWVDLAGIRRTAFREVRTTTRRP